MRVNIVGLTKHNFHEVVTLVWRIMHSEYEDYKRTEAERIVRDNAEGVRVLEVNDEVAGAYIYTETPMVYNLNYLAFKPQFKKTKAAYSLYKDMMQRLSGRPIIIAIYSDNDEILQFAKKRGTFLGRFPAREHKTIEYYSLNRK